MLLGFDEDRPDTAAGSGIETGSASVGVLLPLFTQTLAIHSAHLPPWSFFFFMLNNPRDVQPEGDARLSWIEAYLDRNPKTAILDPIDRVSNCINRVTTLKACLFVFDRGLDDDALEAFWGGRLRGNRRHY